MGKIEIIKHAKRRLLVNFFLKSGLCCLLGFALLTVYIFYQTYDSNNSNPLSIISKYGNATIHFDAYDIPHIQGDSDLSSFFALGYIHAKHRLWQMEFQRHVVKGTLSEILGKKTIEQDKYLRTWGFYQSVQNDWKYFDENTKQIIQSYTDGVNFYLKRNIVPIELALLFHAPEPWTVYDSYAWGKIIAWQQENIWQDKIINFLLLKKFSHSDVLKITKSYTLAPTTLSDDEFSLNQNKPEFVASDNKQTLKHRISKQLHVLMTKNAKTEQQLNIKQMTGKGSNAWVVSGKLTKSGRPILANDVHLELTSPGIWYLADIKSPNLHVTGATLPGSPAVLIGRNEHIAWGVTDAGTDTQDIYILPKSEKLISHEESIQVLGRDSIKYQVYESRFGPVISSVLDNDYFKENISIRWPALLPGDKTIQSFLKINYAYDWESFKLALQDFVAPSLNFLYADKAGNIGYYLAGKIPIRNWSGRYPVKDVNKQWKDYIPFSDLPHTFNPSKGFLVSANNQIISYSYPYSLTYHWREMPYRAQKITEELQNNNSVDIHSTMQLQLNTESTLWHKYRKTLLSVRPLDASSRFAIKKLENWDGNMSKLCVEPTIFAFWFEQIKKLQPKFESYLFQMPNPDFIFRELQENGVFCTMNGYKNCNDFLSHSLSLAMNDIHSKLGSDKKKWQWGNIHNALFKGLLFGDVPLINRFWNRNLITDGDAYSINMGAYNKDYQQIGAAMYRQIIDLSLDNDSYYIIATGESGSLLNKHYSDLLMFWGRGQYIRM